MSGGLYRSFWVENTESPIVSIHGTADATVPYTYGLAANIAFLEGSSLVHAQAESVGLWNNLLTVPGAGHTDLYDQIQWKPFVDTFWVNATTLLESLACATVGTLESPEAFESWTMFPNPNAGQGISLALPSSTLSADLRVLDLSGKVVFEQKSITNHQFVSFNNLPKGMYAVQILHPTQRFALKPLVIN